jgi:hypothetical protein
MWKLPLFLAISISKTVDVIWFGTGKVGKATFHIMEAHDMWEVSAAALKVPATLASLSPPRSVCPQNDAPGIPFPSGFDFARLDPSAVVQLAHFNFSLVGSVPHMLCYVCHPQVKNRNVQRCPIEFWCEKAHHICRLPQKDILCLVDEVNPGSEGHHIVQARLVSQRKHEDLESVVFG